MNSKKIGLLKAQVAYIYAKFKANKLNALTARRYFILMSDKGKLVVTDKSQFYKMRKHGSMPRHITPSMLPRISVYYTAYTHKGKTHPGMSQTTAAHKRQRYLNYIRNILAKK